MSSERLRDRESRLIRRRRIFSIPVPRLKDRINPLENYNALQFKNRYRLEKSTVIFLCDLIKADLCAPVRRGTHIPPVIQLTVALRYFATGGFQLSMGDLHEISQPTVSKIVKRVAIPIAKMCRQYIQYPTGHKAEDNKQKFYRIRQFPGVVGCIDGTHIKIDSPRGNLPQMERQCPDERQLPVPELFRCRKGYFSINVQGVCDTELNFLNIVAKWYGSAHDSRIFENSTLFSDLEDGTSPGLLLGDSGYPLTQQVLTPYKKPITPAQKRYNFAHAATRNTVERMFGVWKRRFNCLNHMRLKLSTCLIVIVAVAVIHNISRRRKDIYRDDTYSESSEDEEETTHTEASGVRAMRETFTLNNFA